MNSLAILFLVVNALGLLLLPRRWAALPLMVGTCYMTLGQAVQIGPLSFSIIRILLLVGCLRVWVRKERPTGPLQTMDWLLILWAAWALISSFFHSNVSEALVFRLGVVYQVSAIYFLARSFCQTLDDVIQLARVTAILLVPVALEMVNEQLTGRNLFSIFGGHATEEVMIRDDRLRAQGPFGHPILAGTVAAVCLPLFVSIWNTHRHASLVGLLAGLTMVVCSASSGPLVSVMLAGFALLMWRKRAFVPALRVLAVVAYILLELVMSRPAYFIIQKMDLTGSSTGWHRAELIRSSIQHLNEWWFAGTDYTRHWMTTGVPASEDHCDITNHYLVYGVMGGVPLMLLFIAMLWVGFRYVGRFVKTTVDEDVNQAKLAWTLGAALFAHAASSISVAYFDQSFVFLFMTLGVIASLHSMLDEELVSQDMSAWASTDEAFES